MMQARDVGLKWEAMLVSILLDTCCYSLEPFLGKCLLHANFLYALSPNLLTISLFIGFSCCGLTLCHS